MTKPVLTSPAITPIDIQLYSRYLPTSFDESLSLLQKVNKVIETLNRLGESNTTIIENWNLLSEWIENGSIMDDVLLKLNEWLNNGTLNNLAIGRFIPIGAESLIAKGSLYIPNDANLFGYASNGVDYVNMATMQDNDLIQFGDYHAGNVWLMSGGFMSLRAPNNPSFQKIDVLGNPIGTGRTIRHQENSSYHLRVFGVGNHTLLKGEWIELHTLTNVQGQFPPATYNNFAYTIPREGMYQFDVTLKLSDVTPVTTKGAIRIAVSRLRDGVETLQEMATVYYDPTTDLSPFAHTQFMYQYKLGDQLTVKVKPINENVTLEEGTRLHLYGLGDTIQI